MRLRSRGQSGTIFSRSAAANDQVSAIPAIELFQRIENGFADLVQCRSASGRRADQNTDIIEAVEHRASVRKRRLPVAEATQLAK
jgi:hypothetical protein